MTDSTPDNRYHRQTLLPQIGADGQARLTSSRVIILGCGALGTASAELLTRAGVGSICLVDRDVVEWTNLQRQTLYDESDARQELPKAVAAARRLKSINSAITLEPRVLDVDSSSIERLLVEPRADLVLDGTDNADTRYLLNDVAVKLGVPWIYGAAVGMEGRVMPILPDSGPCLRCVFPHPPDAGELPTCDTTGVFGPVTAMVGAIQAACALQLLATVESSGAEKLVHLDGWRMRFGEINLTDARDPNCLCCGRRQFEFLARPAHNRSRLCGRSAVQIAPPTESPIDLAALADRLGVSGQVVLHEQMLRFIPSDRLSLALSVFSDGRALVHGTTEPAVAHAIYDRYIGR